MPIYNVTCDLQLFVSLIVRAESEERAIELVDQLNDIDLLEKQGEPMRREDLEVAHEYTDDEEAQMTERIDIDGMKVPKPKPMKKAKRKK